MIQSLLLKKNKHLFCIKAVCKALSLVMNGVQESIMIVVVIINLMLYTVMTTPCPCSIALNPPQTS